MSTEQKNNRAVLSEEHVACAESIAALLKSRLIKAEIVSKVVDGDTWVEINLVNPSVINLEFISKIRSKFEVVADHDYKNRKPHAKKNLVDFVSVNVKYTKGFKNNVWAWIQNKFDSDMGGLPNSYEHLDQYHVGKLSKISAFEMIDNIIFNKLKNYDFWADTKTN